ncbi:hypothetical protein [Candidatus Paracaedibacter symbiosus]|uniref:hypothetical protein n=1 Tax=Candidatus Paracaedibacter symbiosus TaxID=244582 RepID=UPI000509A2A6|nr:hypothetical protein [Candidatus Paracaedibacter symbiosus]
MVYSDTLQQKISLSYGNHLVHELKAYLTSIQDNGLVFSYSLKSTFSAQGMDLVLEQKETNFTLSMNWQEEGEQLLVTRFTINDNKQLESLSSALYEVAGIEIVLQAVDLLFFLAEYQDLGTARFVLEKAESEHLTAFDGFFESFSSQRVMGDKHVTLTLPTTLDAYDLFVVKTENLKDRIRQQLWQEQRDDCYLRRYLQSHKKGESLRLKDLTPEEAKPFPSMGQVLVFPKFSNTL